MDYSRNGMTAPEVKIAGNEPLRCCCHRGTQMQSMACRICHAAAMELLIDSLLASGRTPVIVGVLTAPDEHDAAAKRLDNIQRELLQAVTDCNSLMCAVWAG